jgi:hypothetical protein
VPSIVNGQLVQGDGTVAEQIPDFWRVGLGATGALPDGTTDVTDVIAHQSDIFVGLDALMRVGHGAGNIASNTAVGNNALNANTTGNSNVSVGFNSLLSNTTGTQNVANGVLALLNNTTGSNNTAIGTSALYSNTTGSNNTSNGFQSLFANSTGFSNTANGVFALFSNTTGNLNVANGTSAMYQNTTGTRNSANGVSSLFNNKTGSQNVANGYYSLFSNVSGSYNISNGESCMYHNVSGSFNVSNGFQSLYSNTTGNFNVSSGRESLFSNTIGSNNVSEGAYALYYNQENNNTAIGDQSFNSNNLLLSGATMAASSATQVTLSAPMTPSPPVGSFITINNIVGYTNSISGLLVPKSYKVINDTTLEVTDPSQVLGTTGTATNFEIRQSKGYTNSTAAGKNSEPYASNQVALGDNLVTTTVFGDKIAFDLVAINAAPIGTTLKITGTATGGHGGTVKIIGV